MNWADFGIGALVGGMIGTVIGVVIMSIMVSASRADDLLETDPWEHHK